MVIKQNIYLYGIYSNVGPKEEEIVIYHKILPSNNRRIGTLEGVFISNEPLIKEGEDVDSWDCIIERKSMEWFEEEFNGKFHPFES